MTPVDLSIRVLELTSVARTQALTAVLAIDRCATLEEARAVLEGQYLAACGANDAALRVLTTTPHAPLRAAT